MQDGFVRVAAASVPVTVADPKSNAEKIIARIRQADEKQVNLLVLPELCLTGYSCGDLFYNDLLLEQAEQQLMRVIDETERCAPVVVLGMPLRYEGRLYNCAAVIHQGKLLGLVPKTVLPNYAEFYEKRQFTSGAAFGPDNTRYITFGNEDATESCPFGTGMLFQCDSMPEFTFGVEICEDAWAPKPQSLEMALRGAMIIANPSASDEVIGKAEYRRTLISSTAGRYICGYIYANAAPEESTQDVVFSAHHLISENGALLAEHKPFQPEDDITYTEIDLHRLRSERHHNTSFTDLASPEPVVRVMFHQPVRETALSRTFEKNPFVPDDSEDLADRAELILTMQSTALKRRITHTHCKTAVVGISGGLDSTLALLVMVRAMDMLRRPRTDVVAVTMPCFGTTRRTKSNAVKLCELLGVTVRTVDITQSVKQHFIDIGHDEAVTDVTFENSQARERTQVLMDIANDIGGIVVGTGDLSELALGWATYNGDHMSMYGVNASVPKTLVRYIVRHEAMQADGELKAVLEDILATPVSPELLPVGKDGELVQKTEDLVGPYELHDFFLYYMLRFGMRPRKLFRLIRAAQGDAYDDKTLLHWLETFTRRFFIQQFKRSCLPDGVKVGTVTLSPRGDWRMPSDASSAVWMDEIAQLKQEYLK